MKNHIMSGSRLLEPSLEMKVNNNRNEYPLLKQKKKQEETIFDESKEETSSGFQNSFSYKSDKNPLCSSEDETPLESIEDPVVIRDGTPYNHSGQHLLS